jgi:hypothetical protein
MEYIKKFKEENGETITLYILIAFLTGMVLGFALSPIRNGIAVGSYNGSYNEFENSNNVESPKKKHLFKKCK